jgi:aarF domain-containing kinase
MSGKRILDALALFNVSRKIATKHFDIRLSQVKLYGQTSSLVKTLRTQGPPVVAAAASRFTSSRPPPNPSREGIDQDHFYSPSEQNSTADPPAVEDLEIKQANGRRNPLPDGTIPPQDSPIGQETSDGITFNKRPAGETPQHPVRAHAHADLSPKSSNQSTIPNPTSKPLSPEEARILQRQSEDQIPATSAEPPTGEETGQEFGIEQEQDVFYQPPGSIKPVLSALPRVRVPKTENDIQEGDSHIPPGINSDVYYSGAKSASRGDAPTEEQLSQLFRSPKNAKLFAQKAKYAPGGVSARSFHTSRIVREKASDTDAESIKQLAADMAKDAAKLNVSYLLIY